MKNDPVQGLAMKKWCSSFLFASTSLVFQAFSISSWILILAGGLILGGLTLGGLSACGKQAPAQPKNPVFVYLIDTLRPDHLGCYGYPREVSPHIDAFSQDAYIFTHATTAAPWTRPSVAGLFTGLPPRLHGTRGRAGTLAQAFLTWPEAMQQLGYQTVAVLTNGNLSSTFGFNQGFEYFHLVSREDEPYVRSGELHEEWLPFLELPHDGPVFHYIHSMDPHYPYRPLPQFKVSFHDGLEKKLTRGVEKEHVVWTEHALDSYDQEILQNDDSFGKFLQALKDRGLYEQSWIVLLSDHGEEFWEHGLRGHGNSLHEHLLHVPLIIHPPGGRVGRFAKTMDELANKPFPTHAVADLIGSRVSRRWQALAEHNGKLLGLSAHEIRENLPRPKKLAPDRRWASFNLDGRSGTALEEQGRKLVWRDLPETGWFLYDLRSDPAETMAVRLEAPPSDPLVSRLQKQIMDWSSRTSRGLHLRYESEKPAPSFRIACEHGLRESYLKPGPPPQRFRQRQGGTVAWKPVTGGELYLVGDSESRWSVSVDGQPLQALWPEPAPSLASRTGLLVDWKDFGAEVFSSAVDIDPTKLPAELKQHLRALGYIH